MEQVKRRGRPRGEATKVVRLPLPVASIAQRVAARTPFRFGDVAAFIDISPRTTASVPLMGGTATAGFPSPADDYLDRPLDFNELLIENPAATFAVRIDGLSMIGIGIFPGDIAIVNRAKEPVDQSIILALVDGAFTVKRFRRRAGRVWLHAENPAYADIEIAEEMSFEVWGVITNTIRML